MKRAKCVAMQVDRSWNPLMIFAWASLISISASVSLLAAAIYVH